VKELDEYRQVESGVTAPLGFVAGGLACGIKPSGNLDLGIVFSEHGDCAVAATFTRNVFASPGVRYDRAVVGRGVARAIVYNSGNANAATGEQGFRDTAAMAAGAGAKLGIEPDLVLVSSTGVIGVPLDMDLINKGIDAVELSRDGAGDAAAALLTTDPFPKQAALELDLTTGKVRIGGMCKGSGMIHPDMATMLAYFTTDADLPLDALRELTREVVDVTFNTISVDGDSSTNDTVAFLANGAAGVTLEPGTADFDEFAAAFRALALHLAVEIVRGGEGATRIFEVTVAGASTEADAHLISRAISASSLMKAAVYGADPNFGRMLCAAGYSGARFDPDRVDAWIGEFQVLASGLPVAFDESAASEHMAQPRSLIRLDLHLGTQTATAWGCDLSHEYVTINADYTT
jgi:glutamate N-acetyltransferase/amino-acid N-acetyltransferase